MNSFEIKDLKVLLKHADIKPVVNQSESSVSGMVHNLSKAACL